MENTNNGYIVKGGKVLKGEVKLSGAKNIALKTIIAALCFDGEVTLHNIPRIRDVFELMKLIQLLGGKAEFIDNNIVVIDGSTMKINRVDMMHASKIRVSFMLFAPLLQKFRSCVVANPGGCRIGARPIDRIVDGMRSLGVHVDYDSDTGYYDAKVEREIAGEYTFAKASHTGTELLIMLSAIGANKVTIHNAALEPEIDELITFLNECGAKIKREGGDITVQGVHNLRQKKPFTITNDRNEAVTFATLAITTKGEVTIRNIHAYLLEDFIKSLEQANCGVERLGQDSFRFFYKGPIKPTNIETAPHPGFMTDWQPNWAVLMTQAEGASTIHERVFENRFSYVIELQKLGAKIEFVTIPVSNPKEYYFFNYEEGNTYQQGIKIFGPQKLHGGVLNIADLRAGAALLCGALVAPGESIVYGTSILERGYEDFIGKVQGLGGDIQRL